MAKRPRLAEKDFPEPGSVFVAPTGDGRWAAGRVIRRQFEGGAFAALIVTSRWIDAEFPSLDAPELLEPLVLTHHNWQGTRDIRWTYDRMPVEFQILGKIPPIADDLLDAARQFIDTVEREDLCEAFEQIVCAAGFPQLADEVEYWRRW